MKNYIFALTLALICLFLYIEATNPSFYREENSILGLENAFIILCGTMGSIIGVFVLSFMPKRCK